MRIQAVEAIPLGARFRRRFSFGTTDRVNSQNVIVKITSDEGIAGHGEACPIAAFGSETQGSVVAAVEQISGRLIGEDPLQVEPLIRTLELPLAGRPFALAALDVALWDLAGRIAGMPVWALLGGRFRSRIPLQGSVGWDSGEAMAETAAKQVAEGYTVLKLYVGRDTLHTDLQRIRAVRKAVGQHVRLILDVNGGWCGEECLRALPALQELGIVLLEQPIAAADREEQQKVLCDYPIEVVADEGVFCPADIAAISRLRTARVVNLGLSKLGGLLRARECDAVARSGSLQSMIGSVLEMGIGTTAGLHLAAVLPQLGYPAYLVGPFKYERDIISPPFAVRNGQADVPDGVGLGVEVDAAALRALDLRN